jgi:hypothetical protein
MKSIVAASLCLALLSGCAPALPFAPTPAAPTRSLTVQELIDPVWTREAWRIRQSVLFEFRGARVPMAGFMLFDPQAGIARLIGLNEMGVKLFDLEVFPDTFQEHFLLPELGRYPGLTDAVAESVRRIFLAPQPEVGDAMHIGGSAYRLGRNVDGRQTLFLFGGPGATLLEKSRRGDGEDWRVRYFEYRPAGEFLVPGGILLEDRLAEYRLTLWLEEVKGTNE